MTFRSSILAGVSLIREAIRSPNYVHNVSGWTINQDGSAEFNNIQIRGSSTVGGTALYYAGTPTFGNLRYSISDVAGTDAYGNTYGAGIIAYATGHTGDVGMVSGVFTLGHAPGFVLGATLRQQLFLGGDILLDSGQGDIDHVDNAILRVQAGHSGQTTGSATAPLAQFYDLNAVSDVDVTVSGTVFKSDKSGVRETWHAVSSFGSGWAAGPSGGTYQAIQYRLDAFDNVVLEGALHTTSTTPATVMFTLPNPPKKPRRYVAVLNQSGSASVCFVDIATNGNVSITPNLATSGSDCYIGVTIPLGNIP